ncbi:hypothetical protein [Azohydromonas caseinilytica]|uniref:Uncharacterized protein n=1 Tax=Azohydromonas caseinilytica TaxID=2728836 RepID=A0A848FLN1_9BURK|nr:hypothetical protein [Azohydromonas caseinilytica]NML19123.1 hypothetical protein [Azohydromonas caseinilytica]
MESVVVFTGKDRSTMTQEGGSGHWAARDDRISNAEYVVCVRNRREQWAATDLEHGTAFLVGKIAGTTPAPYDGRVIIKFSEYAEINVPDSWKAITGGQRFPVAYIETNKLFNALGIKLESLEWKPFQESPEQDEPRSKSPFTEAKEWLAKQLNIDADSIEIHIRA